VTDETRARFLTAIAAQLPLARIVEVHLFPAIRQGGMESGVAVVAVEPPNVATLTEPVADAPAAQMADAPSRYIVFSARYRHTLKGPDRGKWETSVTEEADAPLRTVDLVVRGVQRRSGEVDEIVRLSGDELRAVIPATATP
jgi:hypothetical protein